jgi:hypothetical protein
MAVPRIKATYSLEPDVVRAIERIADKWQVSKSEAVSRAIRHASQSSGEVAEALEALDRLQQIVAEKQVDTESWAREAAGERAASDVKRTADDPP